MCSVFAEWGGSAAMLAGSDLSLLVSPHEIAAMKQLAEYPDTVALAARTLAPHLVAYYLQELAAAFHAWYNAEKFLVADEALKLARLALAAAIMQTISNGLRLLGVSAPERM